MRWGRVICESGLWDSTPAILEAVKQKGCPDMRYEMRFVRGHVEVYDKDGGLYFPPIMSGRLRRTWRC